jgi:hypothetical protein
MSVSPRDCKAWLGSGLVLLGVGGLYGYTAEGLVREITSVPVEMEHYQGSSGRRFGLNDGVSTR